MGVVAVLSLLLALLLVLGIGVVAAGIVVLEGEVALAAGAVLPLNIELTDFYSLLVVMPSSDYIIYKFIVNYFIRAFNYNYN